MNCINGLSVLYCHSKRNPEGNFQEAIEKVSYYDYLGMQAKNYRDVHCLKSRKSHGFTMAYTKIH